MKQYKSPVLFYCYAPEDEVLHKQLEKHLSLLRRQQLISSWHDREILPGAEWMKEADAHLLEASIILLLVSSDFLASDYRYGVEMQRALERQKKREAYVIPVLLRPVDLQDAPFAHLQSLPRDNKPVTRWGDLDEAFCDVAKGIRTVVEHLRKVEGMSPLPPLPSWIVNKHVSWKSRTNRERMLKRVRTFWVEGVLEQSLHHVARIELGLQEEPDAIDNPWHLVMQKDKQAVCPLPAGTCITQVYDNADSELLILGKPGAGKTTLLLELTRDLLDRAEHDRTHPIPVIFNLSSWAIKQQPLATWIVEELSSKYKVSHKIGQAWIDANEVLPLLDGLDEVTRKARNSCAQAINTYYQSQLERWGSCPIVICCRSEEYTNLSTHLTLQYAVSILPLTDEQINTYLEQAGEQMKALRQGLAEDTDLYNLARQPLMLNIFTLAYQGAGVSEVPTWENLDDIHHIIFAKYVDSMLKRREPLKRWKLEQVTHWLTFLAKQMQRDDQSVLSIENLQPTGLSRGERILYQRRAELFVGLSGGLAIGPLGGLLVGSFFGLFAGLICGLGLGLLGVLAFWPLLGKCLGLLFGPDAKINPAEELDWSWKEAGYGLLLGLFAKHPKLSLTFGLDIGLFWGLVYGIGGSIFFGPTFGLEFGLLNGLIIKLLLGLTNGLTFGLSGKRLLEPGSLSPNEGTRRSGRNGLFIGLITALFIGPLIGLTIGLFLGQWRSSLGIAFGLFMGLFAGLYFGLACGLQSGLGAFIKHFALRSFLSQKGYLPWDLVSFLDEAAVRLLLRKVGGSYMFVHRQLLDYFATLDGPTPSDTNSHSKRKH